MRTLLPNPPPPEFEAVLEHRRRVGNDVFDEVWDGVLHVNPAPQFGHGVVQTQLSRIIGPLADAARLDFNSSGFNLGQQHDFRVPDAGLARPGHDPLYLDTAALAIEIVSPNDESWEKLPFCAAHQVDEVLIVDPQERAVHWLGRTGDSYAPLERSGLIDLGAAELAERIDWPPSS